MANFQFIEAAGKGYKFVWDERGFLIRLVALPLLIKIASFMLVVSLGLQDNLLRQGLILIPSYFMEGWVVAHAIRLAIFGEIGPLHDVHNRNIIMATSILYALIKLSSSLVAGMMMTGEDVKQSINASQIDANAGIVFGVAFMLAFALWAFRFFWIYVPMAMGCPLHIFLKKIQGFGASFHMLGLWAITAIPPIMTLLALADILIAIFPDSTSERPSMAYMYALATLQAVTETLIALISSVGMAYGVWSLFTNPAKSRS